MYISIEKEKKIIYNFGEKKLRKKPNKDVFNDLKLCKI